MKRPVFICTWIGAAVRPANQAPHTHALGAFLVADNRVSAGHLVTRYVCSLATLTPLTSFAELVYLARSIHGLAHLLRSLPHKMVEYCVSGRR